MTTPTVFHFNDLTIMLHPSVYNPAEDTFLLLESIALSPGTKVLELGTGCGIIAVYCAQQGCHVTCTDINPHALELTYKNIQLNNHLLKGKINVRQGDLFEPLRNNEQFECIIFNPPYLPTTCQETTDDYWFDVAVDGGTTGLSVTRRFLKDISPYLSQEGSGYFVFSTLSDQDRLHSYFTHYLLKYEQCAKQRFNNEELIIYRIFLPY